MDSIRKWFYKPKRDDQSLLAQFFYADEALNLVAAELDSFDGRKDPERCTALVNHLRQCQDKVLTICNRIMDDIIPFDRADRDFRVKFPDDVMQENLAGQLWFGAECLAAGSSIMNREAESARMRPLAKAVTKALENVRNLLREQCLRGGSPADPERLTESLKILDRLFAEFELCYVSAMVPVKSSQEYELHQLVVVLFSETLHRALQMHLLTQEMIDAYDPALMFTIPRLAIVSGLLVFPDGPLCLDRTPQDMSEMFRPFRTLLQKIRELLWTLNKRELYTLEKLLCSSEEVGADFAAPKTDSEGISNPYHVPDLDEFVTRFYIDYPSCKQFVSDFYSSADDGALASWENSDSEDETEWAGEASECDTIVAGRSIESGDTEESIVPSTPLASLGNSMEVSEPDMDIQTPLAAPERSTKAQLELESVESNMEGKVSTITECLTQSDVEVDNNNRSDIKDGSTLQCSGISNEQGGTSTMSHLTEELGDEQQSDGSLLSNPITPLEDCDDEFRNTVSSNRASVEAFKLETRELARLIEELLNHEASFSPMDERTLDSSEGSSQRPRLNCETSTLAFADLAANQAADSLTPSTSSPSSTSENIEIRSGFLLANKMAPTPLEEDGDLPPSCAESLPDGDCKEAMSVATATLSTLLLSDLPGMPSVSPVSPLDSGLGTVVSCSDGGSLSDRSPDAARPSTGNNETNLVLPRANTTLGESPTTQPSNALHEKNPSIGRDSTGNTVAVSSNIQTISCTCSSSGNVEDVTLGDKSACASDGCVCNVAMCDNDVFLHSDRGTDFIDSDNIHLPHNNTHLINISNDDITQVTSVLNTIVAGNIVVDSYEDLTIPLDGATISQHFQKPMSQNNDLNNMSSRGSERLKTRESTLKCVSATGKSSAVTSHRRDGHNFNNPDALPIKSHAYHKDVLKNGNISTNSSKMIEGCSKGRLAKGKFYKKSFRGQTSSRFVDDRNYSCNWDSLVKQHSKVTVPRGKTKRRLPNDINNLTIKDLTIAIESESSYSSTCSSCRSSLTTSSLSDSCSVSSETSSFNSECQDDEEIALAMQAAEIANRNEVRAKFRSSEDLVHRLFVCVAGVADQLQTNFAGDLRHILKCVFLIHNSTEDEEEEERLEEEPLEGNTTTANDSCRTVDSAEEALGWGTSPSVSPEVETPPPWVPDDLAPRCMACESVFTVVRRRHHCRNCGKVFCARCSSNSVALPRYGHAKPVRVCNRCFLYQVTPFTIDQVAVNS